MFDQAIYVKPIELNWNDQEMFNSCVLHEADLENDYLQTNLNIENLNFEWAWEDEIQKKQYNDFLDAKEKMQSDQPRRQFWMSFLKMGELSLIFLKHTKTYER